MFAPPGRPVQCVGEVGGFVVVVAATGVEKPAYFGDGECDEAAGCWCCGVGFGWVGRRVVVFGYPGMLFGPPFLALCAVMARNEWASMARVIESPRRVRRLHFDRTHATPLPVRLP